MKISFIHNDRPRTVEADPGDTLRRHITPAGDQEGPCLTGRCLRCSVLLAGRVVPACQVPIFRVEGMTVHDMEGLDSDTLYRDIRKAFEKIGIHRCVEALPALHMLAYQLLSEASMPTDAELRDFSRHITSRCVSRNEFERATRLAGRVHKRRRNEQSR
jgi:aerobic-type carbon monoxide dehydrogenase small subunit (CoxS/CutS family)